ncbi:MAG: hypothetical protein EBY38_05660 [Flavobacteriaceae bacterium]|nr:hypothetical protein [Flavobacteriaceae bacterium]
MKKSVVRGVLMAVFSLFLFSACEDEPLTGDFVTDEEANDTSEFSATINGESFSASTTTGQLINGVLLLTGTDNFGNIISMVITNIGTCTYDLTQEINPTSFILEAPTEAPYEVLTSLGGAGTAVIETYDQDNQLVSGTFTFTAVREISDGAGGAITESVTVTNGVFHDIAFTLVDGSLDPFECDSGGGQDPGDDPGDSGITDPESSFFALVDGEEFIDQSFVAEILMVGSDEVVKLTATAPTAFTATDPVGINEGEVLITEGALVIDYLPDASIAENTLMAEVDGVSFAATSVEVLLNPSYDTTYIELTGIDAENNQSIALSFPIDITPGTYDLTDAITSGEESVGLFNPDIENAQLFFATPGELIISSYQYSDGVIEGSFSFTAIDPNGVAMEEYSIQMGVFTLTIP